MVFLRWCIGRSNIDVVRLFQRWDDQQPNARDCEQDRRGWPRWSSPTQARTWIPWTGAPKHEFPVAGCPGYTAYVYDNDNLGPNWGMLKKDLWCLTTDGVMNVCTFSSIILIFDFKNVWTNCELFFLKYLSLMTLNLTLTSIKIDFNLIDLKVIKIG